MNACSQEPDTLLCAQGTVIGQGCLTNSYAIRLDRKNKEYGIAENVTFDNVVETLNLPEEFQVNGARIYFTFKKPAEDAGKYLTYCTSAPQVVILDISGQNCPVPVKNSK
ncbi:hypothetical protein GXP67_10570 [Rhodocytophaga rosea]|uniref:Uncharacterized protein n=1 Tax=Rhodocytophaga rosea TaxID=2704465 RepID=A0A6C0GGL6_9BACT|nr:hypothetical protein [Rhodocytophaga rosea]QHT67059.1 hypothetical protein GXP67_10570 [Rhodocytophaga rosea]